MLCPYTFNEHQAAALFALRSDIEIETNKPKNKKASNSKGRADLKTIVSNLPKAELISIIMDISEDYQEIEKKLMFKYTSAKDEISNSKN